jgi:hypothetical protein
MRAAVVSSFTPVFTQILPMIDQALFEASPPQALFAV